MLGVVREVYSKWERRSPITPEHVKQLVQEHGVKVLVQPSRKRVFTDLEFQRAGATITEDLAPAGAILGVKQVHAKALLPDKTYLFFSHTIKAQAANMPLLDVLLEKRVRLIDYETIRDVATGERLVAFGEFAGKAGMIDTLRGLGSRLLGLGISNPFLNVAPAYSYPTLADAMAAIRKVGKAYRAGGGAKSFLPAGHGPLTVVFTGAGKVSRGAQAVFEALDPIILPSVGALDEALDPSAIYGLVVRDADVCRDTRGSFSKKHYMAHPSEYSAALFASKVLPRATVVLTGAYWDARFPRWIPASTFGASAKQLLVLCDAACDVNGSVEFLHRTSTVEDAFFFVDAAKPGVPEVKPADESNADVKLVCAVDILPSELPRDASKHFGDCLMPFLPLLAHGGGVDALPPTLEQAVICANGKLAPSYQYIAAICEERKRAQAKERSRDELRAGTARVLRLRGHLFDSKLMNRALDLVESQGGRFRIVQAGLAQPRGGPGREHRAHTSVLLQVEAASKADTETLVSRIERLVAEAGPDAEASVERLGADFALDPPAAERKEDASFSVHDDAPVASGATAGAGAGSGAGGKTYVVFGAGLVAQPAVELLSRHGRVVVVAGHASEIAALRARIPRGRRIDCVVADVAVDAAAVSSAVSGAEAVVSLLPQPLHRLVADACIAHKVNMVTASYASAFGDARQDVEQRARAAGVAVLCEMGLDPGIDHMAVM